MALPPAHSNPGNFSQIATDDDDDGDDDDDDHDHDNDHDDDDDPNSHRQEPVTPVTPQSMHHPPSVRGASPMSIHFYTPKLGEQSK